MSLFGVPGRTPTKVRLTTPLGQCFFALATRSMYPKHRGSARPLPADAPLLHFPLWSRDGGLFHLPLPMGGPRGSACWRFVRLSSRRVGSWFKRLFSALRRHVVVFSAQMRKIFPFGVPRGALAIHVAPSKLSPICKSPGRVLRVSGERESPPFKPAPNGNILRIRARFPTRWPSPAHFTQGDSLHSSRLLGNGRSLPPEVPFRIWGAGLLAKGGVVCQQGDGGSVSPGCAAS